MQHLSVNRPSISMIAAIVPVLGAALLGTIPVQAQILIMPGESIVLDTEDGAACEELDSGPGVQTNCFFESADIAVVRNLNVAVVSDITLEGEDLLQPQTGSATATMINQVLIPDSPNGIQILPVQIATEVSWLGYLIVGGFNNTFAQVSATLQVRNTTTDQVVASDTFLFERADASLTLDALEVISGTMISNGTGTDITALLERGQTYAIEVEAKCDMAVPFVGGAACLFLHNANSSIDNLPFAVGAFSANGFDIGAITVTVASDAVEDLLGN